MSQRLYLGLAAFLGAAFAVFFLLTCVPAVLETGDVLGAFAAGFVNPFAAGYSTDVLFCWAILARFIVYEARTRGVKHGWVALVLGVVPGVATGFATYLVVRERAKHREA